MIQATVNSNENKDEAEPTLLDLEGLQSKAKSDVRIHNQNQYSRMLQGGSCFTCKVTLHELCDLLNAKRSYTGSDG